MNKAWITSQFHLQATNYFIYSCSSCKEVQIKPGKPPKEWLNWGDLQCITIALKTID